MSQAFYMPTRVLSGVGCVTTHAEALRGLGRKALIVTGRQSAVSTGAGGDVRAALAAQGIRWTLYDQVPPNPGLAEARAAAAVARAEGADFIVGIGGGSPLDAAKAAAVLAVNDLDDQTLFLPPFPQAPLPIVAVPTTAGTGSEVTPYAILTNDTLQTKSNIAHETLFPRLAFLDPRYTYGLPRTVTVNTALDALSHLVEGYLAVRATSLSKTLALQGLTLLGPALRELVDDEVPSSNLRETLQLASTIAGMVITHTGTTAVHALGYPLTYFKGIDHGRANALTLTAYLSFLQNWHPQPVAQVLAALDYTQVEGLGALIDTLLGPREQLTEAEVLQFSHMAAQARNITNTLTPPTEDGLARLYRSSLVV